jgi:hypothetical protein
MQWSELDGILLHTDLVWRKTFSLLFSKDDVNFEVRWPVLVEKTAHDFRVFN